MIWLRWVVASILLFMFVCIALINALQVTYGRKYQGPFFHAFPCYGGLFGMLGILLLPTAVPIKWWHPWFLDTGSLPLVAWNLWVWKFGRWDDSDAIVWLQEMESYVAFKVFGERFYISQRLIWAKDCRTSLNNDIFSAAASGYDRLVLASLKRGADPNAHDGGMGRSTLGEAVMRCRSKTIRRLLESGASIDGIDPDGRDIGSPPLFIAVFVRSAPKIRLLLESGADAKVRVDGHSLLYWAKKRKLSRAGVELLRRAGAEPEPE